MSAAPVPRCSRCGQPRDCRRYRLCLNCIAYQRDYVGRRAALLRSLGRCAVCKERCEGYRCGDCRRRQADQARAQRAARKAGA